MLSLLPFSIFWRHARERLIILSSDIWVTTLKAHGVSNKRLWRVYFLRSLWPTILSLLPTVFSYVLAAIVVVERVFALEGVGYHLANAAQRGDVPVLIGAASLAVFLISMLSSVCNLLILHFAPDRSLEG